MTCRLSGYDAELMIPQMLEIVEKYDVDGFWVDGENWASKPCWCDRCRAEFTRRTGSTEIPQAGERCPTGPRGWRSTAICSSSTWRATPTRSTPASRPAWCAAIGCTPSASPTRSIAPVDYLSGDYDWSWGANRAAVEGRVLDRPREAVGSDGVGLHQDRHDGGQPAVGDEDGQRISARSWRR